MSATSTRPVQRPGALHSVIKMGLRGRRTLGLVARHAFLIVTLAFFLLPVYRLLVMSFMDTPDAYAVPVRWWPSVVRWANYVDIWTKTNIARGALNSAIMTVGSMVGVFLSAPLVAFGFARLRFVGRDLLFLAVLATMMLPGEVTLIPLYIIYKQIGWLDTYLPFIVPAFLGGGAFYIFLLRQFMMTIPGELEDAARMDGCNTLRVFTNIFLPLAKPALASVGIFTFIGGWNSYLGPLIFLSTPSKMPLPVVLAAYRDLEGGFHGNLVMTAACAAVLPCLIIFFVFQEYMVGGIALTGIKG